MAKQVTIGDQQLQLADDFDAALRGLADRSAGNIGNAMARAMVGLLKDLKRFYRDFLDESQPATPSGDGEMRRPAAYSIAEKSARLQELIKLAQGYLPEQYLKAIDEQIKGDLTQAYAMGSDLSQQLAQLVAPDTVAKSPFVGATRAQIEAAGKTTSAYIRREVETFRDDLTRIITDGISQGLSTRKLETQVRQALAGARDPDGLNARMGLRQRAELIARAEIGNAYLNAQKTTAARNGYEYARWIATKDERTCAVCASRHGLIYKLSEMVGTQHPRCRCAISPVSTEAVEETDPDLRATLLREKYWMDSRDDITKAFAGTLKGDPKDAFGKASKILENAVLKPSPSERRQYPGIKEAPRPIGWRK